MKVGEIHTEEDAIKEIAKLEKAMQQAARDLQFEEAAVLRDKIRGIKEGLLFGAEWVYNLKIRKKLELFNEF